MLTKIEAVDFLTNVLEIQDVPGLLSHQDRHYIIDVIMDSYREQIPFQNISTLSIDFGSRRRPSWSEIKNAMFLKQGGICYTHHVFMFSLLKALDYDVSLGLADVGSNMMHVFVFIKNLDKPGDMFVLEVTVPCFRLISLDFKKESQIYVDSYLEYKYIKHNNKIVRMHRKGDQRKPAILKNELVIDGWTRFYEFDFKFQTQDFRDLDKEYDYVYTNPRVPTFRSFLILTIYKNRKARIVHNDKILTENENHDMEKTILETDDEVVKKIQELSPTIKRNSILAAIRNLKLAQLRARY